MNFVAHCLLAESESPEFRFGAVAPDFVGMSRTRLRRIKSPEERANLSTGERAVQEGIDYHIRVDQASDEQPLFRSLKKKFKEEIAIQFFPDDYRLTRLFADIGTEMLLDGYVMRRWPESTGLLYETLGFVEEKDMAIASFTPLSLIRVIRVLRRVFQITLTQK